MWNFLKKMRYVQFGHWELYWKSLLAANWSWRNYTELYVCDCNLLSYSYIFGLIHVYSYSVLSSNPRAKGAVSPWCWKERLRRRIFDCWSLVLFFFDLTPSQLIYFLRSWISATWFTFTSTSTVEPYFLFPPPVYVGPSQSLSPFTRSTPKGSRGRTLRICWGIWPRLIIRGILFRVRNTARVINIIHCDVVPTTKELHGLYMRCECDPMNCLVWSRWPRCKCYNQSAHAS